MWFLQERGSEAAERRQPLREGILSQFLQWETVAQSLWEPWERCRTCPQWDGEELGDATGQRDTSFCTECLALALEQVLRQRDADRAA